MAVLVGLDIGTTSTIGVLIRPDGSTLATASRPVRLYSERPGWSEEDPGQWWSNACAVLRELAAAAEVTGDAVAAVGVTGMLPAVVLLDADDRPIRRSIQQSDARAFAEVEAMRRSVDEAAFFRRTGCGINQQLVAPTLRWLERHEPEAFARIATCYGSYDFVTHRLTGSRSVEHNWALEAGFLEIEGRQIADDLLALGGLRPEQLPPVRTPLDVVGGISAAAAVATGLAEGTRVIAGVADHAASTFAAGVVADGDVLLKFGGSGDIMAATRAPIGDPRLYNDFHVIPGLFMPNGCMAASGAALNWLAATIARDMPRDAGGRSTRPSTGWRRRRRPAPMAWCSCPMCWARRRRCTIPRPAASCSGWGCTMARAMSGGRRWKGSPSASAIISKSSPRPGCRRSVSALRTGVRRAGSGCRSWPTSSSVRSSF